MKIVFSNRIKQKELGKDNSEDKIKIILDYYKRGIFNTIKGDKLPKNTSLIKIYVTSISGEKRIVYLIDMVSKDAFFLFYRDKKDKIGENITIKNKYFKEKLNDYLDILFDDIKNNNLEIYDL